RRVLVPCQDPLGEGRLRFDHLRHVERWGPARARLRRGLPRVWWAGQGRRRIEGGCAHRGSIGATLTGPPGGPPDATNPSSRHHYGLRPTKTTTTPNVREARMQVGLMAPQGWKREYDGWRPQDAWARTLELAAQAEALGFESLWVFDHFHTVPEPADEMTLASFSVLAALAVTTERVRLGHMVVCTGFRNPALTAKMSSTID